MSETLKSAPRGPVFIWAPLARCGITLLQRLITSSREIMIYGENLFLTGMYPAHMAEIVRHTPTGDAARSKMLRGELNFWSSAAYPKMDAYQDALVRSFLELVRCYEVTTLRDGFIRWGIKTPGLAPDGPPQVIRQLIPNSQHIFLYRHLEDVLCSYKSRRWLKTPADVQKAASTYNQHLLKILQIKETEKVMTLRYETLLADPGRELVRLREFLGVQSLDASVLQHRINTFAGEEKNGHSPHGYIEPGELTKDERALAHFHAQDALKNASYIWESEPRRSSAGNRANFQNTAVDRKGLEQRVVTGEEN